MASTSTINALSYQHYALGIVESSLKFYPVKDARLFENHLLDKVQCISIEVVNEQNDNRINLIKRMLLSTVEQLMVAQVLKKEELWVFASDGPWQDDNRINRHQRFWNRTSFRQFGINNIAEKYECSVESESGVRYSGSLKFLNVDIDLVVQLCCNIDANFLVAFNEEGFHGDHTVCDLFNAAYPNLETRISWPSLIKNIEELKCFIIRVDREFHDENILIDLFFLVE